MRKKILIAILAAFAAIPVLAQGPPITKQSAQEYDTPPFIIAPTVANATAAPTAQGSATCYYWIITNQINATSAPLSIPLSTCPTTAGGTAQNPVLLSWNAIPNSTYDVLETTTSAMPVGTNTVAISTGLTVAHLTDTGQARSSYTLLPAGLPWQQFNNLIAGVPTLQWCYNGVCTVGLTPTGFVGACPAGATGQIQYNNGGSCGASANLTFTPATGAFIDLGGTTATSGMVAGANSISVSGVGASNSVTLAGLETGSIATIGADQDIALTSVTSNRVKIGNAGSANRTTLRFFGNTSGNADIGVASAAGTPNLLLLPTTTGTAGQSLVTDGNNPQQTSWSSVTTSLIQFNPTALANSTGGDIAVSATTATNVMNRSITMPASGCPCRVAAYYTLYITTATSGVGYSAWVSDGTTTFAGSNAGQSNGSSGGLTQLSPGLPWSLGTYANNAVVTFTLITEGDHTYTVKGSSGVAGSAPNSSFAIVVSK